MDRHVRSDFVEDGRRVVAAGIAEATAAEHHFGAVALAFADIALDLFEMRSVDHRAHFDRLVERVADDDLPGLVGEPLEDFVAGAALHDEARAGDADLARIAEGGAADLVGGRIHAGVRKDDLRPLAAQFEADLLDVAGGLGADDLADAERAGKAHEIGGRMFGERLADWLAIAGDDVEDAIGQPAIARNLGHADG